ncbi:type II secretion system protein GspM [Eilatimonas milleporae]|uniref:Type II secretory pathway component PulM n=1 Tax=Eilatimonas milleporae TaxID=911205 RepID=A0A3M0CQJ4_9PROT|nr:type II secretion system protein GspM [Eilatimonas milleporae]RMB11808.1 type II secretory pathway component PulM [Eilatimonas milleporae]
MTVSDWTKGWRRLSLREQRLIMAAGVLILLLAGYQFLYRPLIDYRANALSDLEAARTQTAVTLAAASELAALRDAAKGREARRNDVDIRQAVSQTAQRLGVTITRIQPDPSDGLNVWIDDVGSELLFDWLLLLQDEHGVHAAKASVQKNERADTPTLRAQLLLRPGAPS